MNYALATTQLVNAALDVSAVLDQNTLDQVDDVDLRTRLAQLDWWAANYRKTRKPQPRPSDDDDDFIPAPCG